MKKSEIRKKPLLLTRQRPVKAEIAFVFGSSLKRTDKPFGASEPTSSAAAKTASPTAEFSRQAVRPETKNTVLNADTEFKGTLAFGTELQLNGRLEGTITSDSGILTVGESAVVKADIKTKDVIIHGKVQGHIQVQGRVEIRGKGQVYGDIKASSLMVESTAVFVGRSETISTSKPDFDQIFSRLNTHGRANGA